MSHNYIKSPASVRFLKVIAALSIALFAAPVTASQPESGAIFEAQYCRKGLGCFQEFTPHSSPHLRCIVFTKEYTSSYTSWSEFTSAMSCNQK